MYRSRIEAWRPLGLINSPAINSTEITRRKIEPLTMTTVDGSKDRIPINNSYIFIWESRKSPSISVTATMTKYDGKNS